MQEEYREELEEARRKQEADLRKQQEAELRRQQAERDAELRRQQAEEAQKREEAERVLRSQQQAAKNQRRQEWEAEQARKREVADLKRRSANEEGNATASFTGGISALQGYIIILLLLIGLGAPLVGWLKPAPKWEYTVISPEDANLNSKMQEMGTEGWELVFARRATSKYSDSGSYEMILKRPK